MSNSKKPTELEAVKTIHVALAKLTPAERTKVLRAVTSLLEVEPLSGINGNTPPANPATPLSSGTTPIGNQINANTRIDAFVTSKKPTTTYQRLACLAYYLEHHDQITELTGKELAKANADARQPKMSNVSVFLGDATAKYGFFAAVGNAKKSLTSRGSAVVVALPDQAAVKQAMIDHPAPRRSGRRAKAKSK